MMVMTGWLAARHGCHSSESKWLSQSALKDMILGEMGEGRHESMEWRAYASKALHVTDARHAPRNAILNQHMHPTFPATLARPP